MAVPHTTTEPQPAFSYLLERLTSQHFLPVQKALRGTCGSFIHWLLIPLVRLYGSHSCVLPRCFKGEILQEAKLGSGRAGAIDIIATWSTAIPCWGSPPTLHQTHPTYATICHGMQSHLGPWLPKAQTPPRVTQSTHFCMKIP